MSRTRRASTTALPVVKRIQDVCYGGGSPPQVVLRPFVKVLVTKAPIVFPVVAEHGLEVATRHRELFAELLDEFVSG
ncbi:MAG TPA: hypothetical protein VGA66_11280, partial [Mycobacterium sp.]